MAVLRRLLPSAPARSRKALKRQPPALAFTELLEQEKRRYEYSVLVSSLAWEPLALVQL